MRFFFIFSLFICGFGWAQSAPDEILNKIDSMLLNQNPKTEKGYSPPYQTVIRIFKMEGECEIWSRLENEPQMQLQKVIPICAVDRQPGPKLKEGDGKTPEGFFDISFKYGFESSKWFMWINLDNPDRVGKVGEGSCFKTFVEYPTDLDRFQSRFAGFSNPGGAIFAHGNCVSTGCISFKNVDYLSVFAYARHAFLHHPEEDSGPQIHIFPFRFDRVGKQDRVRLAKIVAHRKNELSQEMVLQFWDNLEHGFIVFNQSKQRLEIQRHSGPIEKGETGARILALRKRLNDLGFKVEPNIDTFDPALENKIDEVQKRYNLAPDKKVNIQMMLKLNFFPPGYDISE